MNKNPNLSKNKIAFFEWSEALITAIVIVTVIFTFAFRVVVVSGSSMEDTLHDGDKVLLTDFMYTPNNGDIVVVAKAQNFNEPIIKRVIATQGQTVDINFSTGDVKVDGMILNEPYIKNPTTSDEGTKFPITVPNGYIFVMGDNRMNSKDSRSPQIGLIDIREIVGKAQCTIFPFDRIRGLA